MMQLILKNSIRFKAVTSVFLLVWVLNTESKAQANQSSQFLLSPSIGIGAYGHSESVRFTVPFMVSGDYFFHENLSLGLYIGYWKSSYRLHNSDFNYRSSQLGLRFNFHYWSLLDDAVDLDLMSSKLDGYINLWSGYEYRYRGHSGKGWGGRYRYIGALGFRYFIENNVAVFVELGGTPISRSTLGLSFRF